MLPQFPAFAPIDISHKSAVEAITKQFEPYSDFDFTSLFCWNTDGSTQVAELDGNLVIQLPDYITGEPVYSILGKSKIDESLLKLLQRAGKLELVPEAVVKQIKNIQKFDIAEDLDQFDYVYSLVEHASLSGKHFKSKRNKMSRFSRSHQGEISISPIDFQSKNKCNQLKKVFNQWAEERAKDKEDVLLERKAIDRLLESAKDFNLIGLEIALEDEMVGFAITEISHHDYAVYHFQKTLISNNNPGIDIYLTNQVSKDLLERGCTYINWEQDLGVEGLRNAKINYQPIKMLKKYIVGAK